MGLKTFLIKNSLSLYFIARILITLDKYLKYRTNIIVFPLKRKKIETKNSLKQKDKHTSLIAAHCIL